MSIPKPPYDVELGKVLSQMPIPKTFTREMIGMVRANIDKTYTLAGVLATNAVTCEERKIQGPNGEILLSIFQSKDSKTSVSSVDKPGIYFIHGGGMISGNRYLGMSVVAEWITTFDAVCVSVDYRLAPEHPDPVPIEDCYAGLKWMGEHLEELKIDPKKLIISGQSAGAGLAAGLTMLVRDRGGPQLCAQVLMCPMLDDRNDSTSSKQFVEEGSWSSSTNKMAWSCYVGEGRAARVYAAPGRATDLSGLPPAFIDVGSTEIFRDEDVAYASRLWASGVNAELHVWPGAFHGSDLLFPSAGLSKVAIATRIAWLGRLLSSPP